MVGSVVKGEHRLHFAAYSVRSMAQSLVDSSMSLKGFIAVYSHWNSVSFMAADLRSLVPSLIPSLSFSMAFLSALSHQYYEKVIHK